MLEGRPSLTAERVARRRAAHQLLDRPLVFEDPIAVCIAQVDPAELGRSEQTPLAPYLRAFMAARSRFAEDELAGAVRRGVSQYVILGAGLDTFAYRNPFPAHVLRVFEVDHPATQAWKQARVAGAGLAPTGSLTFAPCDFETQTLPEALAGVGHRSDEPTFFSWLGVVPYLVRETVFETLRYLAGMPQGSGVVFDYGLPAWMLSPLQQTVLNALSQRVAAAGEPFQSFFDPAELAVVLREFGFARIDDVGADLLNARYFRERSDGLRVGSLGRIIAAWT